MKMHPQLKSKMCTMLKTKSQVMKSILLQYFTLEDLVKFSMLCKGVKKWVDPFSELLPNVKKADPNIKDAVHI